MLLQKYFQMYPNDETTIFGFQGAYSWLSNFWPTPITYEGLAYNSVEAAYQAAKALNLNDRLEFTTLTGSQAKSRAAHIKIRPDWDEVKYGIMQELTHKKYESDLLKTKLLETGTRTLIEANTWHDIYWGVCFCPKHKGEGNNNLGNIIMLERNQPFVAELADAQP